MNQKNYTEELMEVEQFYAQRIADRDKIITQLNEQLYTAKKLLQRASEQSKSDELDFFGNKGLRQEIDKFLS